MVDEIKKIFQDIDDVAFADERLKKALEEAKMNDEFRRKNFGKYGVLLCGDHSGNKINLEFLRNLKKELRGNGITCQLGEDYIKEAEGVRQKDIFESYLNDADIIVLINGENPGTVDESKYIREERKLKKKTIAFFRYSDYNTLKQIPNLQDYRTEFKYPVPYREVEELKAKIVFGTKHMILYYLNKEIGSFGGNKF